LIFENQSVLKIFTSGSAEKKFSRVWLQKVKLIRNTTFRRNPQLFPRFSSKVRSKIFHQSLLKNVQAGSGCKNFIKP